MTTESERRQRWLEDRRRAITSGDMGRLLGLGMGGAGPMDVWLGKMGMADESEATERMAWGLRLQRAILEGYADRVGRPIVHADPYTLLRFPEYPILGATLDARCADGDRRCVDAKNVGIRRPDAWGPDGSNIIPDAYAVQLHVQMMVTGTDVADLAVLFGGNSLNVFTVARDPGVCEQIVQTARAFWEQHVETHLPPDIDGGEGWRRFVQRIAQRSEGLIEAPAYMTDDIRALADIRQRLDALTEEKTRLETLIKAGIGEAAGVVCPLGKVTWKQSRDTTTTDYEAVVTSLRSELAEVSQSSSTIEIEDAIARIEAAVAANTQSKPGSRRFLLTLRKGEP